MGLLRGASLLSEPVENDSKAVQERTVRKTKSHFNEPPSLWNCLMRLHGIKASSFRDYSKVQKSYLQACPPKIRATSYVVRPPLKSLSYPHSYAGRNWA